MYGDILDLNPFLWARLLVHLHLLYIIQDFPALQNLAKHGVLPVQVWGRRKSDEELRAVGVGTLVRHAHDSSGIVSQRWPDLVFEELVRRVENGGRSLGLGIGGGRAGLNHE